MSDQTQRNENWVKVLGRAQSDADFRQRLISRPQAVLHENGVDVPAGVEIKVLENGPSQYHLVLPGKPAQHDPDKRLDELVGNGDVAGKQWAQLVDKAWTDEGFKDRLLADARAAIGELGIKLPDHLQIQVVEELPEVAYLILPAPQNDELSEQDLEKVAGGGASHLLGPGGVYRGRGILQPVIDPIVVGPTGGGQSVPPMAPPIENPDPSSW